MPNVRSAETDLDRTDLDRCGDVWCPCARGGECEIRSALPPMYYACEIRHVAFMFPNVDPREGCPRYELIVIDYVRNRRFNIGFTIDPRVASRIAFGPRSNRSVIPRALLADMNDECEVKLWRSIKRESPGTYLEARALGWVPECLTRDDLTR